MPQVDSRTRVVFLQHPRERRVAIGTARMAHLSLPNSELHIGVDFSGHARLEALAAHPAEQALPSELVHLVAMRPATGERFEAVLAPRQPLARSTSLHVEMPEERLLAGEPLESGLARFQAFLRPGDKLAVWTTFALDLLRRDGFPVPEAVNVRLACARALKNKTGGVEQGAEQLGSRLPEQWALGRAGRRIAALEAVVRALDERGRATQPPPRQRMAS